MQFEFSTDTMQERHRFEAWRSQALSIIGAESEPPEQGTAPFYGHVRARSRGCLLNMRYAAQRHRVMRRGKHIAAKPWNSYWIYREDAAGAWFGINGGEFRTRTGDLIVADADLPFETLAAASYNHEVWVVPKPLVDPHLPGLGAPLVANLAGRGGMAGLASSYLTAISERLDQLSETEIQVVADTLGRLLGAACGGIAAEQPDAIRAGRLNQAKRHIEQHLASPDLSPASTAAALGISVRTLHALYGLDTAA